MHHQNPKTEEGITIHAYSTGVLTIGVEDKAKAAAVHSTAICWATKLYMCHHMRMPMTRTMPT